MDKTPLEKSTSFPSQNNENAALEPAINPPDSQQPGDSDQSEDVFSNLNSIITPILEDVDKFLETSSDANDKSSPPEIPECVESLLHIIEKRMANFDQSKFGHQEREEQLVYECLTRISKLINMLNEFASNSSAAAALNRATTVLHLVMSLLDSYFRMILESCFTATRVSEAKTPRSPKLSSENDRPRDQEFPGYSSEEIASMRKLATAMITLGYEKECCMAYNMVRRNAFNIELDKLGYNNIPIEDVQRMQWESLEAEMVSWIQIFKHCISVLLPSEQKLCDSVFSKCPSVSQRLFSDLSSAITVRFLNFAEAVTLSKRSAEKLFKFLDMYETLRDTIAENPILDSNSEIHTAKARLGESAVSIFCDLENSIRRDNGKTPMPSGAVHPLTRYTMNYLRYACEYKDTLEQVFLLQNQKPDGDHPPIAAPSAEPNEDGTPKTSPFAVQLNAIMELLDENLEMKSKLYRDPSLGYVFLMNNGRYILQKIKESEEINDIMGATWCRKRSSDLRLYHKGYQRETWGRLLQCLSHEGLQVNGKVVKPVLKERLKMFNAIFEEIHKTQSTWVVSDKQLQSELRVSISAVIIPAYRSFVGRFQQCLTSGRQTEKYIKYQPEDIENLIEGLFDGNPNSVGRKRQ